MWVKHFPSSVGNIPFPLFSKLTTEHRLFFFLSIILRIFLLPSFLAFFRSTFLPSLSLSNTLYLLSTSSSFLSASHFLHLLVSSWSLPSFPLSFSAVEEAVCHAWLSVSERRIKSPSVGINLRWAAEILFESLQMHWQLSGEAHTHIWRHIHSMLINKSRNVCMLYVKHRNAYYILLYYIISYMHIDSAQQNACTVYTFYGKDVTLWVLCAYDLFPVLFWSLFLSPYLVWFYFLSCFLRPVWLFCPVLTCSTCCVTLSC